MCHFHPAIATLSLLHLQRCHVVFVFYYLFLFDLWATFGNIPGSMFLMVLNRPYGRARTKPDSVTCKSIALPIVLLF